MENPDAKLEIIRDQDGMVTELAYKVANSTERDRRAMEFCEIVSAMFASEKLADEALLLNVTADLHLFEETPGD